MPNGHNGRESMAVETRESLGVLNQRIVTVEATIQEIRTQYSALNTKIDDQNRANNDKIDTLFRSLDQRLSGHIDSISRELSKQVEAVNEKVNTGRIPNYAVVLGLVSTAFVVFGTVWAFGTNPINQKLQDLSTQQVSMRAELVGTINDLSKDKISRDEFEEFKRTYESNRTTSRADMNATFAQLNANLAEVRTSLVPRGEHERVWQNFDQQLTDKQRQIDEIKNRQGATFNERDIIHRLLERTDRQDQLIIELQQKLGQSAPSSNSVIR